MEQLKVDEYVLISETYYKAFNGKVQVSDQICYNVKIAMPYLQYGDCVCTFLCLC